MTSYAVLAPTLALVGTSILALFEVRSNRLNRRISEFLITNFDVQPISTFYSKLIQRLPNREVIENKLALTEATFSLRQLRIKQFTLAGFFALFAVMLNLITQNNTNLVLQLLVPGLFFIGWHLPMSSLNSKYRKMRDSLNFGFGEVVDLLALSVTAGNSLSAALIQISDVVGDPWQQQLARIRYELENGLSIVTTLDRAASRLNHPTFTRFVVAILISLERGTPLSAQLRTQASEVSEMLRRELLSQAGKKETAMLLPIVFLILPTIVIATLFPGILALGKLI